MKGIQEEWDQVWQRAESLLIEAIALVDEGVKTALAHLPELEERNRGQLRLYRYPGNSVDVALALKLVQLWSNIYAGKLLIDNGLFLEWDMTLRSMQDSLEDVSFLIFSEH